MFFKFNYFSILTQQVTNLEKLDGDHLGTLRIKNLFVNARKQVQK